MGRGSDEAFRDLLGLQEKLCRLFDEQSARVRGEGEALQSHWSPAVDIYETGDAFLLVAEIPGVVQDDIQLEITDDVLILRGERPSNTGEPSHSYHRVERPHGLFQRTFRLPVVVDSKAVRASYGQGVLRVTLPKQGSTHGKAIPVELGDG